MTRPALQLPFVSVTEALLKCRIQELYKLHCVYLRVDMLAVKYQLYLTGESVIDPPCFFANQFGHRVASVVGESLNKVLHGEEKKKESTLNSHKTLITIFTSSIKLFCGCFLQLH